MRLLITNRDWNEWKRYLIDSTDWCFFRMQSTQPAYIAAYIQVTQLLDPEFDLVEALLCNPQ